MSKKQKTKSLSDFSQTNEKNDKLICKGYTLLGTFLFQGDLFLTNDELNKAVSVAFFS